MNFVEALRVRRIAFQRQQHNPDEITICCPFCVERRFSTDYRFRLGINLKSSRAQCFNCGWKSRHAITILGKKLEMGELTFRTEKEKKVNPEKLMLPGDCVRLWDVRTDGLGWYKKAWEYIHDVRKVSDKQVVEKRIGVSLSGRYAYRVLFPIYLNKLVGIVGRDFTRQQTPPYLNSEGEKGIYNVPPIKARSRSIILLEGVFDCLAVERAVAKISGLERPDVGALLGNTLTPLQQKQLFGYENIILWPDGDGPGISGMSKVAGGLHNYLARRRLYWVDPMSDSKDPGGGDSTPPLPAEQIMALYEKRKPWTSDVSLSWRAKMAFREA